MTIHNVQERNMTTQWTQQKYAYVLDSDGNLD